MRIIAGKHRGRVLASFSGERVRPTPDRVKESLFQILSDRIVGARVLDLFSGSGALGLESLSRGAREVCFNDLSEESLALVKKNLTLLREEAKLTRQDFRTCLKGAAGKFDLIFCDPPYAEGFLGEILSIVKARGLLSEGGLVVYESEREEEATEGWEAEDIRRYGRTKIFMFGERV